MNEQRIKSTLSRRDFLKVVGIAVGAGALAGAAGPEARSATKAAIQFGVDVLGQVKRKLDVWSYGDRAIRIDRLDLGQDELANRLARLEFTNWGPVPHVVAADVSVGLGDSGVKVSLVAGGEKYFAIPTYGTFQDDEGKVHERLTVDWVKIKPDGTTTYGIQSDSGLNMAEDLWIFSLGIKELNSRAKSIKVYVGLVEDYSGNRIVTPREPGNLPFSVDLYAEVENPNGKRIIYKSSTTNTGPMIGSIGLNPVNIGAEAVKPIR